MRSSPAGFFERFIVIPSIDLKGGEVVRLRQGEMASATVYSRDPAAVAREFEAGGARLIHVVDLDGAVAGEPRNLKSISAIRAAVSCAVEVSGGLRTVSAIRQALDAGADRVSIGSAVVLNPGLLREAAAAFPGRIWGSIDLRGGKPAIKGWVEEAPIGATEIAKRLCEAGAAAIILTDVKKDGTEAGVEPAGIVTFAREVAGTSVIASGGVATLADISTLRGLWEKGIAGVIIGRALYEGRFSLRSAIAAAL